MKIICVAGARPNFMKIAPIMDAFHHHPALDPMLVHTGQHYDEKMSNLFFRELGIPEPEVNLEVGSGSHAVQTAEIMKAFEPILAAERPDAVLVVGDVNSTIACGLVAVKMGVKLIHVEAGLRSFDRTMPEEINRILTDSISDLLFCSEQSGIDNLRQEGVSESKIFLVGNVMIDTLLKNRAKADESSILDDLALEARNYVALTLHRPANVDDPAVLCKLLDAFEAIQDDVPIVFPVHPRTRNNLESSKLSERIHGLDNLRMIEPIGYLDFLKVMASASAVLTDSGGIQEETTILQVPCITLRSNTERPVTTNLGSSRLVGTNADKILAAWQDVREGRWQTPQTPPHWDGQAAKRIATIVAEDEVNRDSDPRSSLSTLSPGQ